MGMRVRFPLKGRSAAEGVDLTVTRLGYARNFAGLRGDWGAVMGWGWV